MASHQKLAPSNSRATLPDACRLKPVASSSPSRLGPQVSRLTYDEAGNITSMTDYHGNTTTYTYTDLNQVDTITAPGSKVWDFNYNDLGQPTDYDHPNGMTTEYTYDTLNRLSKIDHKDGATTKQSFEYTLTDGGNIERVEHEDGVYWDYAYDGRNRLISADRVQSANIVGEYRYTYDDGDNMLTRSEPFLDDFNDADYTGWTVGAGTWSASNAVVADTVSNAANDSIWRTDQDEADYETTFRFRRTTSTGDVMFYARYAGANDFLRVAFLGSGTARIQQTDGGMTTYPDSLSLATAQNTWYNVRVVCDGSAITVWRWEDGDMPDEILSATTTELTTTQSAFFTTFWTTAEFDDIRFTGSNLKTTTTFTYNNANELTPMTMTPGGTTTFTYDDWGRTTQKANSGFTADYAYRYGSMLYSVETDFPGEGDVTYEFGGDKKRRNRTANSVTTTYRYDLGWNILNKEDNSGDLVRSLYYQLPMQGVSRLLAHVDGDDPSSGTAQYYAHDHLGSTRSLYAVNRSALGSYAFSPFGAPNITSGADSGALPGSFTGKPFDSTSGLLLFPLRAYEHEVARWSQRDPIGIRGGINLYAYISNPIRFLDIMGLERVTYDNAYAMNPSADWARCLRDAKLKGEAVVDLAPNPNLPDHVDSLAHCVTVCEMGKCGLGWLAEIWNWAGEFFIPSPDSKEDVEAGTDGLVCPSKDDCIEHCRQNGW